jgi:hypothetical protein
MLIKIRITIAATLVIIFGTSVNAAEECKLTLLTSLQMQPVGSVMSVPVTIENLPKFMLLDTSGFTSQLSNRPWTN